MNVRDQSGTQGMAGQPSSILRKLPCFGFRLENKGDVVFGIAELVKSFGLAEIHESLDDFRYALVLANHTAVEVRLGRHLRGPVGDRSFVVGRDLPCQNSDTFGCHRLHSVQCQ
ncbi:hypothetical protein K227x_09860 [Rubripirellula lacrimiformis]|uniref:Uncharacterized protein n=1 Tax=Rubripirellula lacrimiformis TaxID=1930273 RepID=A0A517N6H6_9BACT|nr:hypothetical protein K227x_09860 [Rubripirellula lacrimiformis]